jgi:hypothetical protein
MLTTSPHPGPAVGILVDGLWIVPLIGTKLGDKWYCVSSGPALILRASRRGKRYRIRRLHQGFRYRQRWLRSSRSDACSFGTLRAPGVSADDRLEFLRPILDETDSV